MDRGSEFLVALAASLGFLISLGSQGINWAWAGAILLGGVAAAPVAAYPVRPVPPRLLAPWSAVPVRPKARPTEPGPPTATGRAAGHGLTTHRDGGRRPSLNPECAVRAQRVR